ncbi:MAG: quinolinate synthase NadA [Bacteroidales bacterium]|nr:quinolinate synthase NadA [Bacteroidales bacterium]
MTNQKQPADELIAQIRALKEEKGAVILAHYYVDGQIQDVADYVGDSLALAQKAAAAAGDARIVVMCGVHFMAETVKALCPDKKVLLPDLSAGCSLADSCPEDEFAAFVAEHPDHTVISYVNTPLGVKAHSHVLVTSGNAVRIVESFPKDAKLIFGPDRNLGGYINDLTGRQMVLWNGACHVHERFTPESILKLKDEYPDAPVLVHPECKRPVALLADKVGSTAALLDYAMKSPAKRFIVVTESGILHKMRQGAPEKEFIPVPPDNAACGCNDCAYMKLNTLEKLRDCLRDEAPEVTIDPAVAERALRPIERMLELSK